MWLEFSNKVVGNGFKFLDYFLSVKRLDTKPIIINNLISIDDLLDSFSLYEIDIDLEKLIDACPFELLDTLKREISVC